MVNRPDVLLLDEPLGALDLKLRRQMQLELKRIQTEVGITFVHVTHDQEEAMTMADTIAVMNAGRIEQLGSPIDLYESPATAYVANFLGQSNLLPAAWPTARGAVGGGRRRRQPDRGAGRPVPVAPAGTCSSGSGRRRCSSSGGASRAGRDERARPAAWSPTRASPASAPSTSCELPSGRQLTAFAQNTGRATVLPVGCSVTVCWEAAHTFGLDGAEDAAAGIETPDGPAAVRADGRADAAARWTRRGRERATRRPGRRA